MVRRNSLARFRVEVVAQQQPRAVADVLDRVREVVDEAGGDAAEHRLPLLPLDVFLQLDEAVGHRVERVAELAELVAACGCRRASSRWPAATACVPRCSVRIGLMNARPKR